MGLQVHRRLQYAALPIYTLWLKQWFPFSLMLLRFDSRLGSYYGSSTRSILFSFQRAKFWKKKLNLSSIFAIYRKREAREVNLVESGISLLNHWNLGSSADIWAIAAAYWLCFPSLQGGTLHSRYGVWSDSEETDWQTQIPSCQVRWHGDVRIGKCYQEMCLQCKLTCAA